MAAAPGGGYVGGAVDGQYVGMCGERTRHAEWLCIYFCFRRALPWRLPLATMAGGAANWLRAFVGGGVIIGVGVLLLKSA